MKVKHGEEWRLNKCQHPSCVLNAWDPKSGKCIFHWDAPDNWLPGGASCVVNYLNGDVYNPEGQIGIVDEPELLLVRGIEIGRDFLNYLKNTLKKPVCFVKCTFLSPDYFEGNTFPAFLGLSECRNLGDNPWVFSRCIFKEGIKFSGEHDDVQFEHCTISRIAQINALSCKLIDCRFEDQNRHIDLRTSDKLTVSSTTCLSPCSFQTGAGEMIFSKCILEKNVVIEVNDNTELVIEGCELYQDLLLRGIGDPIPSPRIKIRGLVRFAGSKTKFARLHFKNYDLKNSDFVFYGIEMEDVNFSRFPGGSRRIMSYELDCWGKLEGWRKWLTILTAWPPIPDAAFSDPKRLYDGASRLIAAYVNLKVHYDNYGDHKLGNDFHIGEMWTRWTRERIRAKYHKVTHNVEGDSGIPRAALSRHWYALYALTSNFGQSLWRPFTILLSSFILGGIFYALTGVDTKDRSGTLLSNVPCHSLLQGFDLALRNLTIWFRPEGVEILSPANAFGCVISFVQYSMTIIAGTFVLLALRRRFKR